MTSAPVLFALVADDDQPNPGGKEPAKESASPFGGIMFPIILMVIAFYFLIIVPGRKERQQRQLLWKTLKKDDEVVTNAGIIGRVSSIKENEDELTLKIDDNTRIRVLKSSIARILNPKETAKEEPKVVKS